MALRVGIRAFRSDVPQGVVMVHVYGTRQIHAAEHASRLARPNATLCGVRVTAIDDLLTPTDFIPLKWDNWRMCRRCYQ